VTPLAVLASRVRYEEKQIFAALERRRVPYVHVDPRRLVAGAGGDGPVFTVAGSDASSVPGGSPGGTAPGGTAPGVPRSSVLPGTVALNREISFTRALYAALLLEARGVRVVNRADVIAVCGDKLRTSLALAAAGLPAPRTMAALTPEAGVEAAELLGFPVVIKPLVGSWGRLAAVARDRETATTVLEHRAALPSPQQHVAYLQELVDKPGRDIRVIVVGDAVVGAVYRYAPTGAGPAGWRTNAARGAETRPCPMSPELTRLAMDAARAVGGGVLGVDLIEAADDLLVLEVNHAVEFRAFQAAHGDAVDVADAIAGHLLDVASVRPDPRHHRTSGRPRHEGRVFEGRDHEGRDHEGRDREGRDHEGRDHEGRDREGRDREGRDREGRDREGRDHREVTR
jgi:[lysine-biosynthesis-protein LysW]---L-2-aminoadipate ligase